MNALTVVPTFKLSGQYSKNMNWLCGLQIRSVQCVVLL